MVFPGEEINKWTELLKTQALDRNNKSVATWSKYKYDLEQTKSLLTLIPQKVKHDVMVPIGPKALMPGTIVHTNEFLVCLGDSWFIKASACQATEICERRIKTCDEMLQKIEAEMQLIVNKYKIPMEQEAFGNEERPEIIEYVTEEEDEEWKKQHRLREKEYRQRLAEMRNKEKTKIETEEDLWRRLDELELQEELEDELNRLHAESSSEEESPNECTEPENKNKTETVTVFRVEFEDKPESEKGKRNFVLFEKEDEDNPKPKGGGEQNTNDLVEKVENILEEYGNEIRVKKKKRVSFACDFDLPEEDPLRLEITHSRAEPVPSECNNKDIVMPSDIYNQYKKIHSNTVLPALKKTVKFGPSVTIPDRDEDIESEDEVMPTSTSVCLKDVVERNHINQSNAQRPGSATKKISQFKTSRMKNP